MRGNDYFLRVIFLFVKSYNFRFSGVVELIKGVRMVRFGKVVCISLRVVFIYIFKR